MNDKVFERRFSERSAFWGVCAAAMGAVCVYIFLKIEEAVPVNVVGGLWIFACAVMACGSYAARRTRLFRSSRLRRWADWSGGLWFIFVFWMFFFIVALEAAQRLLGASFGPAALCLSFAGALTVVAYGVREAGSVETTHLTVATDKLPPGIDRLRIVQLSDLHLGPSAGTAPLARILRRVRSADPDIVVVTGDVTDGRMARRGREMAMLRRIKPKYGVFAVTGNHDYYDSIDDAVDFMRQSGMRVLCGEAVEAGGIIVEGVSDGDHLRSDKWGLSRSETLIVNTYSRHRDKFILLLRHRPVVELGTEGFFDLQLSGHTHGGQVFPLFSSRLFFRGHSRGLKRLKKGSLLYTSNGTGHVGPPVRLMAPPEIVVVDIVRR